MIMKPNLCLSALPFALYSMAAKMQGAQSCHGIIRTFSDVTNAVKCKNVTIEQFAVPKGSILKLAFAQGATINQVGDIIFQENTWTGEPLAMISGVDITYDGNMKVWHGNGQDSWKGNKGRILNHHPAIHIMASGTIKNIYLLNPPAHGFAIVNPQPLTMSGIVMNARLARVTGWDYNTDGFDVQQSVGLTIRDSFVFNSDDCLAVSDSTDFSFINNTCIGGHGIAIGSFADGQKLKNVIISDNRILSSIIGLRIKTLSGIRNGAVEDVVFSGNYAAGITQYGVIVHQDYTNERALSGKVTNGAILSKISFKGKPNHIRVTPGATSVLIRCGTGSCPGPWDWSELVVIGGKAGEISNAQITGCLGCKGGGVNPAAVQTNSPAPGGTHPVNPSGVKNPGTRKSSNTGHATNTPPFPAGASSFLAKPPTGTTSQTNSHSTSQTISHSNAANGSPGAGANLPNKFNSLLGGQSTQPTSPRPKSAGSAATKPSTDVWNFPQADSSVLKNGGGKTYTVKGIEVPV